MMPVSGERLCAEKSHTRFEGEASASEASGGDALFYGGRLRPLFVRRTFNGIRKEKYQYYSVRIGYGRIGELPYLFNETGLDIIKFCDGRHSSSDIVYEMSKLYKDVSINRLRADVEKFLKSLTEYSALLWIGKSLIPRSPWVERINGYVLTACEPEFSFLASLFATRREYTHILLSSDGEGHSFDPVLCGGSAEATMMFALLDQGGQIKVLLTFSIIGHGENLYLNFDRVDLRANSDMRCLSSVLRGSIRIMSAMFREQHRPSIIRVWMRESLPQKQALLKCLKDLGFAEEAKMKSGLSDMIVTAYSQSWNAISEGVA